MSLSQKRYLYGRQTAPIILPNLFIGGMGATITTASLLNDRLSGLVVADIKDFTIDGSNNISCRIDKAFEITLTSAFKIEGTLTYFIEIGGNLKTIGSSAFRQSPNLSVLKADGVTRIQGSYNISENSLKYIRFPNLVERTATQNFNKADTETRIYLPLLQDYGTVSTSQSIFINLNTGCKIYVHPNMLTINGGGLEADLAEARDTYGATIVGVVNFTAPSSISDLSAGTITSSSVVLNFTPPASANTLDFYEVYIDDGTNKPKQIYTSFKELSTSGQTLTGLASGTSYKIKVQACDIYWNRSNYSNEITVVTL